MWTFCWISESPSYTVQERGCGVASGLTFQLTCSTNSGDQRAERRYATYGGGRMYAVEGGQTLASGATVGTSVRVNTVNIPGQTHKVYLNGSLKQTISSPSGSYYDKFGAYRTSSGAGPATP
ncbi:hypothetical protein QMK34_12395 [Amycolatopsis sp. H20-H5]|nr:hypothetical protein [Amycolatopsis sp. H20-H5]MEC3976076.1 hypothetical protein [Amycolatopsis sp. H20-H5]